MTKESFKLILKEADVKFMNLGGLIASTLDDCREGSDEEGFDPQELCMFAKTELSQALQDLQSLIDLFSI